MFALTDAQALKFGGELVGWGQFALVILFCLTVLIMPFVLLRINRRLRRIDDVIRKIGQDVVNELRRR